MKKLLKTHVHLTASIKGLPKIIAPLRNILRDDGPDAAEGLIFIILAVFKYKIPDVDKKSMIRLKLEKPFYSSSVDEIPDLWKLIEVGD